LLPHGPKVTHIFNNPPEAVIIQWVLSLICWAVCLILYYRHRHNLVSAPDSKLRQQYLIVIAFPMVISSLSLICALSVRAAYLWSLGQKLYEARTLYAFLKILMILLGRDPEKNCKQIKDRYSKTNYICSSTYVLPLSLYSAHICAGVVTANYSRFSLSICFCCSTDWHYTVVVIFRWTIFF